jgi:hypothetical protein
VDKITVHNGTIVDCSVAGWCLYNYVYGVGGDKGHNNLLHDLILERGVMLIGDGYRAAWVHVGPSGFFLDWGHNRRFDNPAAGQLARYLPNFNAC